MEASEDAEMASFPGTVRPHPTSIASSRRQLQLQSPPLLQRKLLIIIGREEAGVGALAGVRSAITAISAVTTPVHVLGLGLTTEWEFRRQWQLP